MSNEKFYLCDGNKVCFTSFKCEHGIKLSGSPCRRYATKYDYIHGTENCTTDVILADTREVRTFEGTLKAVDGCPIEKEKLAYEWKSLIQDEGFKNLVKKARGDD